MGLKSLIFVSSFFFDFCFISLFAAYIFIMAKRTTLGINNVVIFMSVKEKLKHRFRGKKRSLK